MNCVYICVQNKLRLRWLWNHLQPLTLAKLFGPHIIKKHHSSWWPIAIALLTYTMGCQETSQGKLWKLWSLKVHHIQPNLILPLVNWGESINQRYPYLNERWTPQNSHVVEVAAQLQPVVAVTGGIGRCIHCCSTLRYLAPKRWPTVLLSRRDKRWYRHIQVVSICIYDINLVIFITATW